MKKQYILPSVDFIKVTDEYGIMKGDSGEADPGTSFAKQNYFFFEENEEDEETVFAKPHTLWDDDKNEEESY